MGWIRKRVCTDENTWGGKKKNKAAANRCAIYWLDAVVVLRRQSKVSVLTLPENPTPTCCSLSVTRHHHQAGQHRHPTAGQHRHPDLYRPLTRVKDWEKGLEITVRVARAHTRSVNLAMHAL